MIARANRFHGYSSLSFAYRYGQTVRNPLLSLRFSINTHRQTWRLAVVVSRKVNKSAVVRNRIRRRIYEVVRLQQQNITKPYDMIITVFSSQLSEIEADKLSSTVLELLSKAKILSPDSLVPLTPPLHAIVKNKED